jgi:Skp family chaperone for outer membrane proteins
VPLMRFHRFLAILAFVLLSAGAAAQAFAEPPVSSEDVQRLQSHIADVAREVAALRQQHVALGTQLQEEIDAARDKAADFKLKLQRKEEIDRNEYVDVGTKVDNIRERAHDAAAKGGA